MTEQPTTNSVPTPPSSLPAVPAQQPQQQVVEEFIEESSGGRGCLWGILGLTGCLLVPIVIIAGTILLGVTTLDRLTGGFGNALDDVVNIFRGNRTVNIYDESLILERVQAMSELTTTKYSFSNIVTSEFEMPSLLQALYGDKLVMVAVGHINAGIDLSQLTQEDVITQEDGSLILRLPAPQLQDCFLDEGESYVVERDTGFFTNQTPALDEASRRFAIKRFRDMAIENGIYDEAKFQAQTTIYEFLNLFDTVNTVGETSENAFANIDIVFATNDGITPEFPATCQ